MGNSTKDMKTQTEGKKKSKKPLWIIILLILLLAATAVGIVYWQNSKSDEKFERYEFDTAAMAGRIQQMSEEEIQEELNRIVEEGMFNISIASSIVFESPDGEGQARIENIESNRYHMQVDIFLKDTEECVYSSKLIKPGYSIEYIKLDKELEPGEYEATAIFSAITQEEMQLFGEAGAEIKLYVLEGDEDEEDSTDVSEEESAEAAEDEDSEELEEESSEEVSEEAE